MKVNRKQLVDVLEKVAPALGFNVLVPEFQNFQIDGNRIQTTDGVMLIDTALPVDTELKCAIPGAPFLHLLQSLNDEEVELIYKDGTLSVKTNRVKGVFTTSTITSLKNIDDLLQEPVVGISGNLSDLIQGFGFCRFGVSEDKTSGPLCGVRIESDSVFGTDRYRIVKWSLKTASSIKCSLPLKFVNVVLKYKDEILSMHYVEDERFIVMLEDGTYIGTAVLAGDYPDLLQYFPNASVASYREVELVDDLTDVLERHISFLKNVNEIDKEITIKICKDKCIVSSIDKELGTLREELKVSSEEDPEVEFHVNPVFLKDIMRVCSSFKYYAYEGLVLFKADELEYLVQVRK